MGRTVDVVRFREECLALLDTLDADGIVTRDGRPVAKVMPIESESSELIGAFADHLKIRGDIVSPGGKWDAES